MYYYAGQLLQVGASPSLTDLVALRSQTRKNGKQSDYARLELVYNIVIYASRNRPRLLLLRDLASTK